jgi:hypothetical protein
MPDDRATALEPEDVTRLIVERVDAGDGEGVAALYEPDAVPSRIRRERRRSGATRSAAPSRRRARTSASAR